MRIRTRLATVALVLALTLPALAGDTATMIVGKWTAHLGVPMTFIFTKSGTMIEQSDFLALWGTYRVSGNNHLLVTTSGQRGGQPLPNMGNEADWGLVDWVSNSEFLLGSSKYDFKRQ